MHTFLNKNTKEDFAYAASLLKENQLIVFPTETVYGLGGNAYSDCAVAKIFQYKNRPIFNPLIVHYDCLKSAKQDVLITDVAEKLAHAFMPGPLTILLNKKNDSKLSALATSGLSTVCIRIPAHKIAKKLLSILPFPLVAPSANKSTEISPTTAQAASESLIDNENLTIIDGGKCIVGLESTIIDARNDEQIKFLRYGCITQENIEAVASLCNVSIVDTIQNNNIECPGQLLKHYSPSKIILINVNIKDVGINDALLAIGLHNHCNCKYMLNLSQNNNLAEAASNLFHMLRELDKTDAHKICVMKIPNIGIGLAINDKLIKASSKI